MATLLHLPFSELAPVLANRVADMSPVHALGELMDGAAIVDAKLFTGASGYVRLQSIPVVSDVFTLEYWVTSQTPNLGNIGQGQYSNGIWNGLSCSIRGRLGASAARIYLWATTSADEQFIDVPLPPVNQRNSVAVVRNGAAAKVFINGTLAGSRTGLSLNAPSAMPMYVGRWDYPVEPEIVPVHFEDVRWSDEALYWDDYTPSGPFPYTPLSVCISEVPAEAHLSAYPVQAPFIANLPAITGSKNIYHGGAGTVVGTVERKGSPNAPLARRVRLFRDRDAICVGEQWSNAAGQFAFPCLDEAETYTALAYDHTGEFESVCASRLLAGVI